MRRSLGLLAAALVATAVVAGAYVASEAGDGTTSAQEGAASPTATPKSAVVFGTPPPGAERGSWTPVPRCPEPTPTPAPDGWILTPDGWEFAPDKWTPTATASPAPWPCVPYDEPTPPPGDPDFPLPTRPPQLTAEEQARIRAENPSSGTPVDYPREWPLGDGKTITVPPGAIYYTLLVGVRQFDVIEKGESKVSIDLRTMEISQWNVAPQDEDEFRRLILEPLTDSD